MNKTELIQSVSKVLTENNIKKPIRIEKHIFKIMDITFSDETEMGRISVRPQNKLVRYTAEDVSNILEGMIAVITDSIQHGEKVSLKGLGNFTIFRRPPRKIRKPDTGELIDIPERFTIKYSPSSNIREAAIVYGSINKNNPEGFIMPEPIYDQFEAPDEIEEEGLDGEDNGGGFGSDADQSGL